MKARRLCIACGDPAGCFIGANPYCRECYEELTEGKVKCESVHPDGMGGIYGPIYDDDPSPWGENAVRCLEDCS